MKAKWLDKWKQYVGKADPFNRDQPQFVALPENTSFTKNFQNALTFAQTPLEMKGRVPVLFFISVRNWSGFSGFRLNRAQFSAHYHEDEILLFEGFKVFVLKVEENVAAKDLDTKITVVHLYSH